MDIAQRTIKEAKYIIATDKTIREIAKIFGVSKSTVHKDLQERLKQIDISLYKDIQKVLKKHKDYRHIKGGNATKKKYLKNPNLRIKT